MCVSPQVHLPVPLSSAQATEPDRATWDRQNEGLAGSRVLLSDVQLQAGLHAEVLLILSTPGISNRPCL
jgi:hypothetical protein